MDGVLNFFQEFFIVNITTLEFYSSLLMYSYLFSRLEQSYSLLQLENLGFKMINR